MGLFLPNSEGKGRLGVYRGDLGNATAEAACKPGVYPFWPFLSLETKGLAFRNEGDHESLRLAMAGRVKGLEFQTRALDRVWHVLFMLPKSRTG